MPRPTLTPPGEYDPDQVREAVRHVLAEPEFVELFAAWARSRLVARRRSSPPLSPEDAIQKALADLFGGLKDGPPS